ncbi:MAG TPA: sulfatase, partial [Clostridiales bacterium]|nr:sulfatase [Clostridiales bacterium]
MLKSRKIVFIMTDTQRWDMLGCYRNTGLRTPNLDRLAGEGIRYDRAYTTQPVCQPARAGIFTGQYPHSVGSWANSSGLSNNARTIGQRLSKEGVHTAYIGKYHLDGGDYFGLGKCPDGWDPEYWYDMRNYLEELTDRERLDSRNADLMLSRDFSETFPFGHRCTDRAIDFLKRCHSEDFFLVLSYDEPHSPSICPMPYSKMYQDFAFPISDNVYDDMRGKPEHQKIWG